VRSSSSTAARLPGTHSPVWVPRRPGYGGDMSQITDSVSSIAQDLSEKAAVIAQDVAIRAQAVGDFGADLVDSGLKKLQDAGVVAKPKRSKKPWLALLIIIVGGAVAFKVLKGRGSSSASPAMPQADRLADANAVKVG